MEKNPVYIRIDVNRRQFIAAAAAVLVLAGARPLDSESLTMTTYYPAPSGVYRRLVSTGNAILARDAGGLVGIGKTNPSQKLDVNGNIYASGGLAAAGSVSANGQISAVGNIQTNGTFRVGSFPSNPPGVNGTMYYNSSTGKFMGFQNGAWRTIGTSAALGGNYGMHWGCCDSETGHNGFRPGWYTCPAGWVVTGVVWYEGISADSDAGDNIGVRCAPLLNQ
jgi:hypothetical protein